MPVILSPELWEQWLYPTLADPAKLLPLLKPSTHGTLTMCRVSKTVNASSNDGPQLVNEIR